MKKLWAPWRFKFILHVDKSECIFCTKPKEEDDKAYILYRGSFNFVILNIFPYNSGHIMIAPYSHKAGPELLTEEEYNEMFKLLQVSINGIKKVYKPDGFNIGFNVGKVAGAGYDSHIHLHVVPRWNGDTNFMPIIGDVKVVSEGIEETYKKLRPIFYENP